MTPWWRRHAGESRVPDSRRWQCSCGHEWDGSLPECPSEETDPGQDHRVKRADTHQEVNSADAKQKAVDVDREPKANPTDDAH